MTIRITDCLRCDRGPSLLAPYGWGVLTPTELTALERRYIAPIGRPSPAYRSNAAFWRNACGNPQ
jgi:hypothetical protein